VATSAGVGSAPEFFGQGLKDDQELELLRSVGGVPVLDAGRCAQCPVRLRAHWEAILFRRQQSNPMP
jgi:hypothetical protein